MIEVATFRLAAGVEDEHFVAADAAAQTAFFNLQPGLRRRTTARGGDGQWVTITLWAADEDADRTHAAASQDPAALAVADLVDDSTLAVHRYHELD